MAGSRWDRIGRILESAAEVPAEERAAWIEKACEGDLELAHEIESLLASAPGTEFLEPLFEKTPTPKPEAAALGLIGQRVGPYRVLERIGAGGMGTVYLAEREEGDFEQRVALKVVQERASSEELLERFREERQILAQLEHPNICRLLDGGSTEEGRPYLVMEYVQGEPIDLFCDRRALSIHERIALFRSVCLAVHAAHGRLVIHRDLKPSNILVAEDGSAKLLDFGIAKVLDPERSVDDTLTTERRMTPRYASPEQIQGKTLGVECDVYSLGVVLYELLSGVRPYSLTGKTPAEIERIICDGSRQRPSQAVTADGLKGEPASQTTTTPEEIAARRASLPARLRRTLDGDLDTILLKALHAEPDRRYSSAEAVAEDLRRYLEGLPVLARPDSTGYRIRKFATRHAVAVALTTAATLALLVSLVFLAVLYMQAEAARKDAGIERQRALDEAEVARSVSTLLQDALASVDPILAQGRDATILEDLVLEVRYRIDRELNEAPLVAARLHHTLGLVFRKLARYEDSEEHLLRALDLVERGGSEEGRLAVLIELAHLRSNQERWEESLEFSRRGLAEADPATDEYPYLLGAMATVFRSQGKPEESLRLHQEVVDWYVDHQGPRAPEVATALSHLGLAHTVDFEFEKAAEALEQAEDIAREVWKPTDPRLTHVLHNHAWALVGGDRPEEARPLIEEALHLNRQIWPRGHRKIAVALAVYGTVLDQLGELEAAGEALQEAEEQFRQSTGDATWDFASVVNNLALNLQNRGEARAAIEGYARAEAAFRKSVGDEHSAVAAAMSNRGRLLFSTGRVEEAEELLREVHRMRLELLRVGHPDIGQVLRTYGTCLHALGRTEGARALFDQEVDRCSAQLGVDHPDFARLLNEYGQFLAGIGKNEEAAEWFGEAAQILQAAD